MSILASMSGLTTCGLTDSDPRGLVVVERRRPDALVEGISAVHNTGPVPASAPPASSPPLPPRRRPSAGTLLTLVNGVLAGVGGVYVSTHSVLITVIAGVMAIVLAVMVLIFQR